MTKLNEQYILACDRISSRVQQMRLPYLMPKNKREQEKLQLLNGVMDAICAVKEEGTYLDPTSD